jgi:serine/alanine adding enzyme
MLPIDEIAPQADQCASLKPVTSTRHRAESAIVRQLTAADGVCRQIAHEVGDATLAHAPEWYAVIRRAYGHDPLYYAAEDEMGRRGMLPAFIVRRPLFGTVVTSMPFLDGGGPCTSSPVLAGRLIRRLIVDAERLGARAVEVRCTSRLPVAVQPEQHKVILTLDLFRDADRLWRHFDGDVRNKVRRAGRCGLSVDVGGVENLIEFYDVLVARMHDLGSPVHAIEFLRAAVEEFGDRARIVLVRRGRMAIGGLVALASKDTLVVPWSACLKEYFRLHPNMLLYWETIRFACAEGFGRFDFGRSTVQSGTYHFKRQWGALDSPLFWYTIPVRGRAGRPLIAPGAADTVTKVWQRLPIPLTRRLGPPIRKYLTQ